MKCRWCDRVDQKRVHGKRLKEFIARRGRSKAIYSDNTNVFKAAAGRTHRIMQSEKMNDLLAKNEIKWKLNLSRAPWWGEVSMKGFLVLPSS